MKHINKVVLTCLMFCLALNCTFAYGQNSSEKSAPRQLKSKKAATKQGGDQPSQESAVDPADIIDRFVESLGGEMVLVGAENMSVNVKYFGGGTDMEKTFHSMDGQRIGIDKSKSVKFDGKKWTQKDSSGIVRDLTAKGQNYDLHFDLPSDALRLIDIADEMVGAEKSSYSETIFAHCICLKLKNPETSDIRRYFDPETDLLAGIERWDLVDGVWINKFRIYEMQYADHDGVTFLKTAKRTNFSNWECDATYTKFRIDSEFDESVFDFDQ